MLAKASAPGTPVVDNVGPHSADVSWTEPWSDGGSPIKGNSVQIFRATLKIYLVDMAQLVC